MELKPQHNIQKTDIQVILEHWRVVFLTNYKYKVERRKKRLSGHIIDQWIKQVSSK